MGEGRAERGREGIGVGGRVGMGVGSGQGEIGGSCFCAGKK